jgi:hypothetical protein
MSFFGNKAQLFTNQSDGLFGQRVVSSSNISQEGSCCVPTGSEPCNCDPAQPMFAPMGHIFRAGTTTFFDGKHWF